MQQIDRIRDKLIAKGFSLPPPATLERVAEFEAAHKISLPEGYREFIVNIANGGIGPADYGLIPLGHAADDMRGNERTEWIQLRNISKPFPFTRHWIWESGESSEEGTLADVKCGSILIGNDGCGAYWHLIVTGPDRGIPWMLTGEGIQPVCPKRGFLQWYEDWLDGRDSFYGFDYSTA